MLGFSIRGPNPRAKNHGPNPARLPSGFFSRSPDPPPLGPVKGLGPIRGPTKKKILKPNQLKKKICFPEKKESQQQCNTNNKSKWISSQIHHTHSNFLFTETKYIWNQTIHGNQIHLKSKSKTSTFKEHRILTTKSKSPNPQVKQRDLNPQTHWSNKEKVEEEHDTRCRKSPWLWSLGFNCH